MAAGRDIPIDEIWTTEDVAQYLKVSDEKVRVDAKKGIIPGFQLGSLWRFRSEQIRKMGSKAA